MNIFFDLSSLVVSSISRSHESPPEGGITKEEHVNRNFTIFSYTGVLELSVTVGVSKTLPKDLTVIKQFL